MAFYKKYATIRIHRKTEAPKQEVPIVSLRAWSTEEYQGETFEFVSLNRPPSCLVYFSQTIVVLQNEAITTAKRGAVQGFPCLQLKDKLPQSGFHPLASLFRPIQLFISYNEIQYWNNVFTTLVDLKTSFILTACDNLTGTIKCFSKGHDLIFSPF